MSRDLQYFPVMFPIILTIILLFIHVYVPYYSKNFPYFSWFSICFFLEFPIIPYQKELGNPKKTHGKRSGLRTHGLGLDGCRLRRRWHRHLQWHHHLKYPQGLNSIQNSSEIPFKYHLKYLRSSKGSMILEKDDGFDQKGWWYFYGSVFGVEWGLYGLTQIQDLTRNWIKPDHIYIICIL